jgi:hypothetical protein
MSNHIKIRWIDGVRWVCRDIGCDDFDRAAENRQMIKQGLFARAYEEVEDYLRRAPVTRRLPKWVPVGSLPEVGWRDRG